MFKKIKIGLFAGVLSVSTVFAQYYPQNARIQSLGGTFLFEDITDIMRYPSFIKNYGDQIQVTFTSPIIAIKSLGENMQIGLIANRGLLLSSSFANDFYNVGKNRLATFASGADVSGQYIPHVIFGVGVSGFNLGFDVFLEHARSTSSIDSTSKELQSQSAAIFNPGFIASGQFSAEKLQISGKLGLGFPSIHGTYTSSVPADSEVSSDKGLFFEAGAELTIPLSNFQVKAGIDWILEHYAFARNDSLTSPDYSTRRTSVYAGVEDDIFEKGKWSAMYNLRIRHHHEDETTPVTDESYLQNIFSGGLENSWDSVWIFSSFIARGGFNWVIETPFRSSQTGDLKSSSKSRTTFSSVIPTVGLGVTKGMFTLDLNLNLNPGGWDKLITGPGIMAVTAGLKF